MAEKKLTLSIAWWGYTLAALIGAIAIVIISFSRMSLGIMATTAQCQKMRTNLISLRPDLETTSASDSAQSYALPQTGILPTNPMYGFKIVRDWLWLTFSFDPMRKSEISLLLADKKVAEALQLLSWQQPDKALIGAKEAVKYLKSSKEWANSAVECDEKTNQEVKIWNAGKAYDGIFHQTFDTAFNLDQKSYSDLLKELNDWNQSQEQEQKARTI